MARRWLPIGRPPDTPFHSRFTGRVRSASPPEFLAGGIVALVVVALIAYAARRRLLQGVAVVAEAVEEIADTVEDAAEDLADAARERAESG
jgi:hypothetical protein